MAWFRNVRTFTQNGWIRHDFRRDDSPEDIDGSAMIAIPGFIDTHIHGIGGCGTEDMSEQAILSMSETLLKAGTTAFFPTLYTDTYDVMMAALKAIVSASGKEKGARIAGIHIEGPFISENKIGAQNPLGRKDPDIRLFREFVQEGKGLVKAMTIAPELPGTREIAEEAARCGVTLLMGHTDATYDEALRGMDMGIRHATHLFNAMSGFNHRNPGVAGCALMHPQMHAEIIADGVHVHKDIVKFLLETKGSGKVVTVTDSLRPTMQESGELTANRVLVEMGPGLWVTKGKPDLYQGSALTMLKAFRNLIAWGVSLEDAINSTSLTPGLLYSIENDDYILLSDRLELIKVLKGERLNVV